jgi:5'-nucleotidase
MMLSHVRRRRQGVLWSCVVGFVWMVSLAPCVRAQETPYRILVTNDDGLQAEGLAALVQALEQTAELLVVAPHAEQSGSSHATHLLREKLRVTPQYKAGTLFGYSVTGTPADAVRFGIVQLSQGKKIDLVVSGINPGANVGVLSHYSGTVGAAMEALVHGVPAVAVSQSHRRSEYATAAQFTAQLVAQLKQRGAPPGVVLSVNIPDGALRGVLIAPMGGAYVTVDGFEERYDDTGMAYYAPQWRLVRVTEEATDTRAYQDQWITITPLRLDWTDYPTIEALRQWPLHVE